MASNVSSVTADSVLAKSASLIMSVLLVSAIVDNQSSSDADRDPEL